ncbi:conserved hypothetical protein [Leishmania mexicana MHOM/GT/2001/U1103]|uniref:Uncharacterized protein n=1 Tax=Leishmania mexicana (strain MHOM/GT/2001/U1103) TaxID=929439 RepID=E9ATJ1_LEIMU|nr:conserved hypothetical protein [Leishmania mexicana MHOM/GT/2001/U1103]CBZ26265.1 conserved hypothetical protein [Leishmania mexicana MHOM/GT/2001/U1103]
MEADTHFIFQYSTREGHSWLKRDVMSRNYSLITPAYGCGLVNAVLSALEDAAAHAPVEIDATVKIQAAFRMYQQRKAFLMLRQHACLIQRVYRGYATRKRLDGERATVRRMAYLQTVFDMFATRIQACYRGYQSRKTRSNYYAQQAYLNVVTARSSEVLVQALSTQAEQDALRNAEAKRVHNLSYARRTAHMHYMVSTCSVPSVYQLSPASSTAKQSTQNTSKTCKAVRSHGGECGVVSPVPPAVKSAGEGSDDCAADDEKLMTRAATYVSGQKLEEDIRHHARAARLERNAVKAKASHSPGVLTVPATASSPSPDKTIVAGPEAEGAPMSATSQVSGPRLPALTPSQSAQRSRPVNSTAPAATVTVPWEVSSAHPPQKPLTPRAPPLTGPSFSQTAPPATSSRTTRTHRTPRKAQQAAEDDNFHATGTAAVPTAGPAPSAASIDPSVSRAAVSSFHRRFAVKRHDCLEHQLSISNGVVSDGNSSHALSSALLSAKEDAAVQRSVGHKVMQALHGDVIFKVSARQGLQ